MSPGNRSCDVLVVGGGPAGLSAAIALRQRGADVLVADALRPPIDKACGEGLMPDSRRELLPLGIELDPRLGAEFSGIHFAGPTTQVSAEFTAGRGLGVRRTVLHTALLRRARELGVRMEWGASVIVRAGNATIGGDACVHRWLIGADGPASRVRSCAGLDAEDRCSRRFGFRRHFHLAPWSEYVEIHWGSAGQAYVTPVGAEEICVAAVTRHAGLRFEDVLSGIPFLREKLTGAAATTSERGSVTLTRRLQRVTRGQVALIGDASGSADAVTGEGLALAFRQALLLAESLASGGLELYEARHARILALPQRMSALLLLMDRFPALQHRAVAALAARPQLLRRLLAVHVGEQTLPSFVLHHGMEMSAILFAPRPA